MQEAGTNVPSSTVVANDGNRFFIIANQPNTMDSHPLRRRCHNAPSLEVKQNQRGGVQDE